MPLDEGERELYWSHAELIGTQVLKRALELSHPLCEHSALVVGSIVHEQHCMFAPFGVLRVQLSDQLLDEQQHCHAVVPALVDGEVGIPRAGDAENDGQRLQALKLGLLGVPAYRKPSVRCGLGLSEDGLVDVDDCLALVQARNEGGSCSLSLLKAPGLVHLRGDRSNLPVAHAQILLENVPDSG